MNKVEIIENFSVWYEIFSVIHTRKRLDTINGIKIYIYPNESKGKHKLPHLHAEYNEKKVVVRIDNGEIIEGNIDKNKQRVLKKWIKENQELIIKNWNELNEGIFLPIL